MKRPWPLVVLRWSDEDSVYIAEAPELSGCMAHGATQAAALSSMNQAVDLWIAVAKEFGDPIPAPREGPGQCAT